MRQPPHIKTTGGFRSGQIPFFSVRGLTGSAPGSDSPNKKLLTGVGGEYGNFPLKNNPIWFRASKGINVQMHFKMAERLCKKMLPLCALWSIPAMGQNKKFHSQGMTRFPHLKTLGGDTCSQKPLFVVLTRLCGTWGLIPPPENC